VHVTETCDDETPNLITDVTTTPATTSDFAVLPTIQAHLAARRLTPREQLVDAGYVTSDHLLTSRTAHGIALVGPVPADQKLAGAGKERLRGGQLCDRRGRQTGDLPARAAERGVDGTPGSAWSCHSPHRLQ
jgi:hypothetical protein